MNKYPMVSIVFPTLNLSETANCLKSIAKLDYLKNKLEIIIVNNGARKAQSLKRKAQNYNSKLKIKIIINKTNLGFGKSVNQGIKISKGNYLLITNDDVVFDKDYLIQLINYLERKPLVGIAGGKIYYQKPKRKIAFCGAKFDFYTGRLSLGKTPNSISQTDWVPGCNMLIRRQVLETIGLFDEKFFFYFEDLDLCLRAKKNNWKVVYFPKAVMQHQEGRSINKKIKQVKSNYYYAGKTRLIFKHAGMFRIVIALLFQFTFGLGYQLLVLKSQNYTAALKALTANLKNIPDPNQAPNLKTKNFGKLIREKLPSVAVISPTFNGKKLIAELLKSIKTQDYPFSKIEVIIVDNASTDGTASLIEKNFPLVKLISLKRNTGSAPPVTIAAKITKSDYILLANDDVLLDRNCLKQLITTAVSNSRIGITTGKMLDLQPPHKALFFGFRVNPYFGYHPYDFRDSDKIRECDWAPGACMLIKRALLQDIGYFDDQYIFCGDDHDACFQVRSLGYKIIYNPKAIYYHGFTRAKKTSQLNLFAHYRGKIRFMIKNSTPLQMIVFFPAQIFVGPFFSYFKFGHKTFLPIIKALNWNINNIKQTLNARKKADLRRRNYLK